MSTETAICGQCGSSQTISKLTLVHKCTKCGSQMWREPEHLTCIKCGKPIGREAYERTTDGPSHTKNCTWTGYTFPISTPPSRSPLEEFDLALLTITQRRGQVYGHPADDFAKAAAMIERLPYWEDSRFTHIARMILAKLARLAASPTHVDSLVDIAGYARTWVMILERDYPHGIQQEKQLADAAGGPTNPEEGPHPADHAEDPNDGRGTLTPGRPGRDDYWGGVGTATGSVSASDPRRLDPRKRYNLP